MKPILKKYDFQSDSSFIAREDIGNSIINNWHYHFECELVYIERGNGILYLGDDIRVFREGDIILVGTGIPHFFDHEKIPNRGLPIERTRALVMLFSPEIFGERFLGLSECQGIKHLLELSKRGILIKDSNKNDITRMMNEVILQKSGRKLIIYFIFFNY